MSLPHTHRGNADGVQGPASHAPHLHHTATVWWKNLQNPPEAQEQQLSGRPALEGRGFLVPLRGQGLDCLPPHHPLAPPLHLHPGPPAAQSGDTQQDAGDWGPHCQTQDGRIVNPFLVSVTGSNQPPETNKDSTSETPQLHHSEQRPNREFLPDTAGKTCPGRVGQGT